MRVLLAAALSASLLAALPGSASACPEACPTQTPVLGMDAGDDQVSLTGLGDVKPRKVWLGGNVSTTFFDLRWTRWGTRTAAATGRGFHRAPYRRSVRIRLRAERLRDCSGVRAYTRLRISWHTGSGWTRYHSEKICLP